MGPDGFFLFYSKAALRTLLVPVLSNTTFLQGTNKLRVSKAMNSFLGDKNEGETASFVTRVSKQNKHPKIRRRFTIYNTANTRAGLTPRNGPGILGIDQPLTRLPCFSYDIMICSVYGLY